MSTSVFGCRARLKNVCAQTPYGRKRVEGRNAESYILVSVRDRFKRQNKTKSDKKPGDQRGRSHHRRETRPAPPPLQLPTPVTSRGSAQRPVILNDRQQQRRWNLLLVVFFSLSFIIHTYLVLKQNKNVAPTRSGREGGINPPQPSLPSAISEVPC